MSAVRKVGTTPFGDLNAPPESLAYAVALKVEAQGALNSYQSDVQQLETWLAMLQADDRYRRLESPNGRPFRSWEEFCTAKQPFGLGYSPTAIAHLISERRGAHQLAADPAVAPLPQHGGKRAKLVPMEQGDNVTLNRGNDSSYLVRRLKRDAPEVADALARGEYRSARAAAKAAGIVKDRTPLEWLHFWWSKADAHARETFLREVSK